MPLRSPWPALLAACLALTCARVPSAPTPAPPPTALPTAPLPPSPPAPARPLPPGAVARLGAGELRHAGSVYALAFSPDGSALASTGLDGVVRLHARTSGQQLAAWPIPRSATHGVAYSPDGTLLAVMLDGDGGIQLRSAATGALLRTLPSRTSALAPVAFVDGSSAVATVIDGHVRVLDAATGGLRAELGKGGLEVQCLAAATRWVASAERVPGGGTLWIWDHRAGGAGAATPLPGTPASTAMTADGALVAVSLEDHRLVIVPRERPAEARVVPLPALALHLAFAPDGRSLALALNDGAVSLLDVASGREVRRFVYPGGSVVHVAFAPDGRTLGATAGDGIVLLDVATWQRLPATEGHRDSVDQVAFLGADDRLVTAGWDEQVLVWQRTPEGAYRPVERHALRAAALVPTGPATVAALQRTRRGDGDFGLDAVEIPGGARAPLLQRSPTPIFDGFALSASRSPLAYRPAAYALALQGVGAPATKTTISTSGLITELRFSPDGAFLAGAEHDAPRIRVWRAADGALTRTLTLGRPEPSRLSLAWAPDGTRLAIAAAALLRPDLPESGALYVFSLPSGKEELRLRLSLEPGRHPAFTPDGRALVMPMGNGARMLDAHTGAELRRFEGHTAPVLAAAVSPSGALVATVSADATAIVWANPPP